MGQGVWIDSEKLDWDDEVREVLKHGTLSVGFIGLAETLKALTGAHHGESADGAEPGPGDHRRTCAAAATRPAQSTGMNVHAAGHARRGPVRPLRAASTARATASIPGVTDREYYTNSFHVPVYYDISAVRQDPASRRPTTR